MFLLNGLLMGGTFLLVSQWLQLVEGLTPLRAGLLLVPQAVAMIGATMWLRCWPVGSGRGTRWPSGN